MAITLGCPACSKRFRARDESAGKRVKCPYCAAAVPVPTADEAEGARAETAPVPTAAPRPAPPAPPLAPTRPAAPPPSRPAVASPADWGAADPPPVPAPAAPAFPADAPKPAARAVPRPAPARGAKPKGADGPAKTPDQLAAPGWRKTRGGLGWVLFGLFLLALPGFVGFAKVACERAGSPWPTGPGNDWVSIAGYVNSPDPNSVQLSKEDLLAAAAYGLPVVLGLLVVGFGRATCAAAPRSSGAKGLFALSGLFTFAALAALVVAAVGGKLLLTTAAGYAAVGLVVFGLLAEFWFLTGVAAAGVALKRPAAARAVGLVGFVAGLAAVAATVGWDVYRSEFRPAKPGEDVLLYEQAALMLGWLLVVGVYWRAVRVLRGAIAEFLEAAG